MDYDLVPELLDQLRRGTGPVERLIAEWAVPAGIGLSTESPVHEAGYAAAFDVIDKFRRQLGPAGDPSWVDDVVPGRDPADERGEDFVFALFRRPPAYLYVRLRGAIGPAASQLRLVAGAVRIPNGHFGHQ